MRIGFQTADFEALAKLWNDFYPSEFRIDAEILRQNTVGSPVFDWGASQIAVMDDRILGFVAVKQSADKLYGKAPTDTAHVSALAFTEVDAGIDFLADVKSLLRHRGIQTLTYGADSRHFFPGCPNGAQGLCSFLMVEGFEDGAECYDVERDLQSYASPKEAPEGITFRSLEPNESQVLDALISSEFSGRWRYDVLEKVQVEGPGCVYVVENNGQLIGFALIQDWTNRQPIGGGVWRNSLGENWGSLGPIGVAAAHRGKGIGDGLLSAALLELKGRGVKRCIIDWTVLKDFYGRHGFEVTRTYQAKTLRLSD